MESVEQQSNFIIAVAGLTRCGSSMTMKMLHMGGIQPFADNYASYETELILRLPKHHSWLKDCRGKAVKILEPLVSTPPTDYRYKFIWLSRDPKEQAKSMRKFMSALQGIHLPKRELPKLVASIEKDTKASIKLLREYPDSELLCLNFEGIIGNPMYAAKKMSHFIGIELDCHKMAAVVQRRPTTCLPFLLEAVSV